MVGEVGKVGREGVSAREGLEVHCLFTLLGRILDLWFVGSKRRFWYGRFGGYQDCVVGDE
jgi:hypothetical protein